MAATAQSVTPHKGSILRASAQGVSSPREFQKSCMFFPYPPDILPAWTHSELMYSKGIQSHSEIS